MGTTIAIARKQIIGITIPRIRTARCVTELVVAVACGEYIGEICVD
jgi:hypothetical protein